MRGTVALLPRAASVLLTVLLGFLLGISGQSATAAVAVAPPDSLAYTYDGDHASVALTCANIERGPPTYAYTGVTALDAVDRWSPAASARPDGTTRRLASCYTTLARFAQGDLATDMTVGHAQVAGMEFPPLQRSESATNAGTKLGWSTGDDIYSLTKAGNAPAWSTVRGRFWKNEAANPQIDNWSTANLDRMSRGLAPRGTTQADYLIAFDAVLRVVIGDETVYAEPGFPVVELARSLTTWLGSPDQGDFEFDSMSFEEIGSIAFRQSTAGWTFGSVFQTCLRLLPSIGLRSSSVAVA